MALLHALVDMHDRQIDFCGLHLATSSNALYLEAYVYMCVVFYHTCLCCTLNSTAPVYMGNSNLLVMGLFNPNIVSTHNNILMILLRLTQTLGDCST